MPRIIVEVLSTWQVIAIFILIMIVLPTIFYFASFDKKPVKIKKKVMRSAPAPRRVQPNIQENNEEIDEDE
ncbi:MAG: hypothetical protein JXR70_08165 [Spirochaetales bacterium]|nr:hypothetical protein [Spirochaetales bacterium]